MSTSTSKKRRTHATHPHFFGVYLNMARRNAYIILRHLTDDYTLKGGVDEDKLWQVSLLNAPSNDPFQLDRILKDLTHHFPFLQYLRTATNDLPSFKQVSDTLKAAFTLLTPLRNSHSHYIHGSNVQDYGVFPKELPNIYKAAIERLQKRFNHAEKGFTDADVEAVKTVRYVRYTEGVALDETTLAFFICLFLEPKYAFRFLNGLQAIQSPDTAEGRATQWSFAMFCCRLPQPKLESSDIMLDMLNELGKCPDPLYRVLSEADKKQFDRSVLRVPKDAALETPDLTPDTEGSDNKVQMKRHETNRKEEAFDDRFAYFALRYFDDKNVFPTLRFQLQLAKFTKEKYRKVIYREEQDRLLQKPIRLFGKYAPYRHLYDKVNQDNLQKRVIDTNYVEQFPETWRMETDGVTV